MLLLGVGHCLRGVQPQLGRVSGKKNNSGRSKYRAACEPGRELPRSNCLNVRLCNSVDWVAVNLLTFDL